MLDVARYLSRAIHDHGGCLDYFGRYHDYFGACYDYFGGFYDRFHSCRDNFGGCHDYFDGSNVSFGGCHDYDDGDTDVVNLLFSPTILVTLVCWSSVHNRYRPAREHVDNDDEDDDDHDDDFSNGKDIYYDNANDDEDYLAGGWEWIVNWELGT